MSDVFNSMIRGMKEALEYARGGGKGRVVRHTADTGETQEPAQTQPRDTGGDGEAGDKPTGG